jgi:hypothetical protein
MEVPLESVLARLDLPEGFGYALLMLALALLLAPYLGGSDFGLVKIPKFEPPVRRALRIAGPFLISAAILAHVPLFAATDGPLRGHVDSDVDRTAVPNVLEVSPGEEVLAPRNDGLCLYPATVLSWDGEVVRLRFAFGKDGQVPIERVMRQPGNEPERVSLTDQVIVRLAPQAMWAPGEITEIREGRAMVALNPDTDCASLYERPYAWVALTGQDWRLLEEKR